MPADRERRADRLKPRLQTWVAVARKRACANKQPGQNKEPKESHRGLLTALMFALLCCGGALGATSAQGWRIDEAHTSIGFKIDAAGFPTTRGRFTHYTGRIFLDFERPARSFTNFTVDSASVELGSSSFNDFVKSAALLDVAKYPTVSFASTRVEKQDSRTARVSGNLTMLGVTKPLALIVDVEADPSARGRPVSFSATATIKRSDFGMVFGLPLIDDTVELTVKTRALTNE